MVAENPLDKNSLRRFIGENVDSAIRRAIERNPELRKYCAFAPREAPPIALPDPCWIVENSEKKIWVSHGDKRLCVFSFQKFAEIVAKEISEQTEEKFGIRSYPLVILVREFSEIFEYAIVDFKGKPGRYVLFPLEGDI